MANYIDLLNIYGTDYKVFAQGGTLSEPLVVNGGDGSGSQVVGRIILDDTDTGQITDSDNHTLFGFIDATNIYLNHDNYALTVRGSAISFSTLPTYGGNNFVTTADLSGYIKTSYAGIQTITTTDTTVIDKTTALNLKSNDANESFISFTNSSGTLIGKFGANQSNQPIFYDPTLSPSTHQTIGSRRLALYEELDNYVTVGGTTLQTISGPKVFTGTVGNTQVSAGVYLGLDTNSSPNANIAICSANTAAYIDLCTPNIDYGFRIIKWNDTNNTSAQFTYGSETGGGTITVPHATGTMVMSVNNTAADSNGNIQLSIPTSINGLTGGTVSGTSTIIASSGDTALSVQSKATNSYIAFKNTSGTILGYYGVNASQQPVFYTNQDKRIALYSEKTDVKVDNVHQSSMNFSYSNGILTITPTA